MLPRSQRLSVEQFDAVMKNGRVSHSPLFLLRIVENTRENRIASVVSKKISKKAVKRNQIRRRIYIALEPIFGKLNKTVNVIVFYKGTTDLMDTIDLSGEIEKVFVKAGLIN